MKLGSIIDSYDIVARVGDYCKLVHDEVGSRTDILCENFWFWDDKYKIDRQGLYDEWVSQNTKFINYIWPDSNGLKNFLNINNSRLEISYQPFEIQLKIRDILGSPTKGMCAIYDMLSHPIKELFLVGFSFCKGFGYRKDYFTNPYRVPTGEVEYVNPHESANYISKWTVRLSGYDHNLEGELNWFKDIKDKRIVCDEWLERIRCE
jgi:hypothetical protein